MKQERLFSKDGPWEGTDQAKPTLKVVVLYDDLRAATRAICVFTKLAGRFGDQFELRCDLWHFDALGLPEVQEEAARAGGAANLLIISARGDTDLQAVEAWLHQTVAGKAPGSVGLMALLESHDKLSDIQCRTRQLLQRAADRNGLEFFLHEIDQPQESLGLTPEDIQARANTVSSVLKEIPDWPESGLGFERGNARRCEGPFGNKLGKDRTR